MPTESDKLALVYLPSSYVGRGPPETCMQIAAQYASAGFSTEIMMVRARVPVAPTVTATEALPGFLRFAPWSTVSTLGVRNLDRLFIRRLRQCDPQRTIVNVWPGWPSPILPEARRLGFTVVRDMINCACAVSRPILDEAAVRQGIPKTHDISDALVHAETAELAQYDYIFSPSEEVDRSLREIGIADDRILQDSFGWNPARFDSSVEEAKGASLRFLFVGLIGVRKGVPELLAAWEKAALPDAELLIVGDIEPAYKATFAEKLPATARHIPFTKNLGGFYKSADVFVFPSLEEGAPQVVYEAAGCGATILTTPMGGARMIESGKNGVIVPPADVDALAAAMRRLAEDDAFRQQLGRAGQERAQHFSYPAVGGRRAATLRGLLDSRSNVSGGEDAGAPLSLTR